MGANETHHKGSDHPGIRHFEAWASDPRLRRELVMLRDQARGWSHSSGYHGLHALIPRPDGETVINRYELKALLDKLESLDAADSGEPPGQAG